jgi:DNA-binding MarR family transcriptional regulator
MDDLGIRRNKRPSADVVTARKDIMRRLLSRDDGTTTKELIDACCITKQAVSQYLKKLGAFRTKGRWYLKEGGE